MNNRFYRMNDVKKIDRTIKEDRITRNKYYETNKLKHKSIKKRIPKFFIS